jgi:hypothetical protein
MRASLFSILIGLLVLPATAQDSADQDHSLEGIWSHESENPELTLEIASGISSDTLRLTLMGSHSPTLIERETIECLIANPSSGRLEILRCPKTTLSRTSPPSQTTLDLPPESEAREGLQTLVQKITAGIERSGNSLVLGSEEQYRLVKQE